ncbi:MAG: hypothetical protein ACRDNL_23870, partial [Spirillospora sp.]
MSAFGAVRQSRGLRKALTASSRIADPGGALEVLREARAAVVEDPSAVAGGLVFELVQATLASRFRPLLTDHDFVEAEILTDWVPRSPGWESGAAEAWRPLVEARDARGERGAAVLLLARLFRLLDPADPYAVDVAVAMAQRRTVGEAVSASPDELTVYADALSRARRR